MTESCHKGWTCDVCQEQIDEPIDGKLAWRPSDGPTEFTLHHHACQWDRRAAHANLSDVMSAGPAFLVSYFIQDPSGGDGKPPFPVADLQAWGDVFRRLFAPGYEDVRCLLHLEGAKEILAGRFVDAYPGYWRQFKALDTDE